MQIVFAFWALCIGAAVFLWVIDPGWFAFVERYRAVYDADELLAAALFLWPISQGVLHVAQPLFRHLAGDLEQQQSEKWLPRILGTIETPTYLAAWLGGFPQFIPFWMTLKVAGGWKRWQEEDGRNVFQIHLISSLWVALVATAGYWFLVGTGAVSP